MATYEDHPTTTVSSLASKAGPKYTSYQAHTEVLVNTNMIDVSTDLGLATSTPAVEIHVYDGTPAGGVGTGDFKIQINGGDLLRVPIAQLPLIVDNMEITQLEVGSDTSTDDPSIIAFFK